MPYRWSFLFLLCLCLVMCGCESPSKKSNSEKSKELSPISMPLPSGQKNRLANEKSPYLLQHADNPVDWYPWGEEAFAKARKDDKPVFLSIGYSTCHWCHVMEHESFENPEIAGILNAHFVAIKVDREERPDIDNIYMSAVMMLTGSGGWPMSLFLTPEKKPFAGGTYFPPESQWGRPGFKEMLLSIHDLWKKDRKKVMEAGQSITEALKKGSSRGTVQTALLNERTLQKAYNSFKRSFDPQYGGFGSAPKFPSSHNLSFLLRYWKRSGEAKALGMVEKTLQEMARGGMYDHIGGGFHRYSTDRRWHVPHFEKMLYDQAMLSKIYLEAYQATENPEYANTAREIFDYVLRDMRDRDGGFYSAEDADSLPPEDYASMSPAPGQSHKKKEGAFYLWGHDEIKKILKEEEREIFNFHYGVLPNGNVRQDPHGEFKGKNILYVAKEIKETAQKFQNATDDVTQILARAKEQLFSVRVQRPRPHLDDKILVDWNGLMISSLALGSRVLNEPRYKEAAQQAAQFVLQRLVRKDGRLLHRYRDGQAAILGTIEDYAFFIHGLIDLYEATFKTEYLKEAKRLTEEMIRLFWIEGAVFEKEGGFYFTGKDAERLLYRQRELYDGAIPSGNSVAALDLIRLARLTFEKDLEKRAEMLAQAFSGDVDQMPNAYAQFLIALDFAIGPSKEIVIAAEAKDPKALAMIKILYSRFLPNKVVAFRPGSEPEAQDIIALVPFIKEQKPLSGQTTAYVCENFICKRPTNDIEEFKKQLGLKEQ